jgi:hypothetical protein
VSFGPALGQGGCPLTRCGPKLRDALGICERHPLALKEPTRPSASSGHIVRRRVNFPSKSCVVLVGGFEMNPLLMVYFSAGTTFVGLGLVKLQARLERWAYERHAED